MNRDARPKRPVGLMRPMDPLGPMRPSRHRRARDPIATLVRLALVPALLLGGCWKYADSKQPPEVEIDTGVVVTPQIPTALVTPVLSVRRAPGTLARDANAAEFGTALQSVFSMIDDTSCLAVSVDGVLIAAKNAALGLRPASNVKLITAAVALDVLGPDFTYTTKVVGAVGEGGVVQGNMYLVGGGDPVLMSNWWHGPNAKYPPFNGTSIESLADSIYAAGIRRIEGSVVGDASRYDDEWYAPTWTSDVRFTEGGPISALLVNDSREAPDKSSNDPSAGAATVLTGLLRERGVEIVGEPRAGTAPGGTAIAQVSSQPLARILAEMLTTSDNNTAEMVLKEIGLAAGGSGTRDAGLTVMVAKLKEWGIPFDGEWLVDGSGLSDENRLTCGTLLALLQRGSFDDAIGSGLPVGGAEGGTLSDAFVIGEPLNGLIRAKTGTLYNYSDGVDGKPGAKTLSGYVPLPGGGAIEFSMLLNGPMIAEQVNYRPIWQQFAAVLADYVSSPGADVLGPK